MLLLAAATVVVLLPACASSPSAGPVVTAEFRRGTGLYPGSPVRVLGINIGRITDVRNVKGHVSVRMQLDRGTRLPATAHATIVPLTLLGERYVQFGPAYRSGPMLRDGAHIPLSRTSVPTEIDELLRGLQDFMGAIDPKRAGDVVTTLAGVLQGRGDDVNALIHNASGTLDLLADKGDDIKAIIASLRDLSSTLRGRTDSIESLIQNYDLVSQVLIDNKGDLDGAITQLDRATVELTKLITTHEDPLRTDVKNLASTGGTLAANTKNLEITLKSTVKLFEAAGRAYESRTKSLRVNNQASPELTSDILAGRLRDRIAGLCRRLGIPACSDPASPLLNNVAGLLPGILRGSDAGPPAPPSKPPSNPTPTLPAPPALPTLPALPTDDQLLAALIQQLTDGIDQAHLDLLQVLDGPRLTALLGLDPILLQALSKLDAKQVERIRTAKLADLPQLMLDLYNEVFPPAGRLDDPLLPPLPTTTLPPLPGGITVPRLPLGG